MNILNFLGFGRNRRMSAADLLSQEAKAAAAWIETVNPLRGMTATRMQALYDASRNGDTVHLQWLYQEIERVDPTLLTCAARRRGALASLDWHVSTRAEKRARGFDRKLAEEQAYCLELAFGGADAENMNDAVEHLAGAFFRGFAHVLPLWSADGLSLRGFETLDQWNFVRDISTGTWYWNPEANAYTDYSSCRPIPDGEVFVFSCPYHIDYPALAIYLRSAVGEKGWARFVERFGIPPVILTMPNDIPKDQVDMWRAQAERVAEGGSGAVPGGTGVNFCDGARGINPFKDFVHNQRELIVLMATGGLLTSLAESGSGTLAGGAHADTWAEIRRGDAAKLGSAINRALAGAILDRAFPGRPHLAYFAFDAEAVPSPGEVFEDAAKARSAGYLIAREDLEERTGYRLEKIETPPAPGEGTAPAPHLFNKETSAPPLKTPSSALKTAPGDPDGQGEGDGSRALLEAFSRDTGPAADAIRELLADPSPEAAKRLLDELNSLIPEDPALAAVIADAMAAEFASVYSKSHPSQKSQPSQNAPLANKTDANGMEHAESGEGGGQFVTKDGGASDGQPAETDNEHHPATTEQVSEFQNNLPDKITPEEFDSLLTTGFIDKDGAGNNVKYGTLLRDHWGTDNHGVNDIKARKARLGIAVRMVRESKPMPSGNPNKPNEKVYFGLVDGKAYIAVADEHNEIDAIEMVSYRRDSRKDER